MTDDERQVTLEALHAYESETQRYLRSYGNLSVGHDDCCPTAQARAKARAVEKAALETRLALTESAIAAVGWDGTP